jgi:capsular polysaccharide transport system permease protein
VSLPEVALDRANGLLDLLRLQGRILVALMVHDVKTRFFGTPLGFIVAILWPVSHIFIIIAINGAVGRAPPYGDSPALFIATGVVPFMCFNYMSRFIVLGVIMNRPLLGYPIVKVSDLLLARAILELLTAAVVVLVAIFILMVMGINVWPPRPIEAVYALLACLSLGFGFGIVNAVITGVFPFWFTIFSLFQIVLWMASGVVLVPDEYPEAARYALSFNPILISVEWMRSAYYEGYGLGPLLDKQYLLGFAAVSIFVGLLMERLLRGSLMR